MGLGAWVVPFFQARYFFVGTASNGYGWLIGRLPWLRETTNPCDTKVGHPSDYLANLEGIPILLSQKMDLDPFPHEDCTSANAQGLKSWSCHVLLRRLTTDRIGIRDGAPIFVGLLALGVFHLLKPPKTKTMIPIGDRFPLKRAARSKHPEDLTEQNKFSSCQPSTC